MTSTRHLEEQLRRELQNYTDAHFGEVYRSGDDEEIDLLFERYLGQFTGVVSDDHQYGPQAFESEDAYERAVEEYEEFNGWLEEQRERLLFPSVERRMTTHERRARGWQDTKSL